MLYMLYMLYTLSCGKLAYVSELDEYPRSERICVCVSDVWSFASVENCSVFKFGSVTAREVSKATSAWKIQHVYDRFDVMLCIHSYRSDCFCTQDASVGVCAQVKSVYRSYGPPKYSTKDKFLEVDWISFLRTALVRQCLQFDLITVCLSCVWAMFACIRFYGIIWRSIVCPILLTVFVDWFSVQF